ncbi:MAG TPA: LON peptidase substrate-binding domain-containing protein [Terriglobia bacterium]|nr:LON peptidase substrate-binding domain-containing protein [Terriglobia bacterium]
MGENLLPLFPLKVVLFPRTEIPLHIFEERYKEMIGECLANRTEFGIVLVLEEGLASTGCTAVVSEVIRRFEDGRMDILVRGQRRFELSGLDQERSYLRGDAEFFEDEDEPLAPDDARREQALRLYERAAAQLAGSQSQEAADLPAVDDPELSFQIASRLPVDLVFRQTLLQLRSEAVRLERVIAYLQKLALRLTRSVEVQARAGANGRVH